MDAGIDTRPFTQVSTSEAVWLAWMDRGRREGEIVGGK